MFGFLFFIILAVVLLMQRVFVHPLRLYTFFCCMESLVLGRCTLLASHFQERLLRLCTRSGGVGDRRFHAQ